MKHTDPGSSVNYKHIKHDENTKARHNQTAQNQR